MKAKSTHFIWAIIFTIGALFAYRGAMDARQDMADYERQMLIENMRAELKMNTPQSVLDATVWETIDNKLTTKGE